MTGLPEFPFRLSSPDLKRPGLSQQGFISEIADPVSASRLGYIRSIGDATPFPPSPEHMTFFLHPARGSAYVDAIIDPSGHQQACIAGFNHHQSG
ncbi:hypothetical protein IFM61392_00507 [Aspergillus lentulus]|nr:hypothetical protein IFM61392_00507 [Aspergillus lentulus]